ncbi:tyrosine-type recombinase/integrase [Paenibacillus algorifonticola]|uniref:tyrosine-type recombinase/integrase n=1 Tax=Paenibacillus algorifonticola TaxID=684063 RepID=UPI003D2CA613
MKDTIMVALETKRGTPIKRGKAETPTDAAVKLTRSWRAFFNWMHSECFVEKNPFVGIGKEKSERSIIETFSNAQMKSLLNAPNRSTFTGLRDYTIMLTLLDTGIRISELEGIDLHHVDWRERTIKVYGKGRKERLVPMSRVLEKALRITARFAACWIATHYSSISITTPLRFAAFNRR